MIFNCQRKNEGPIDIGWHIHRVEAPDAATARFMMFDRSFAMEWLDPSKTNVWPEEWTAT